MAVDHITAVLLDEAIEVPGSGPSALQTLSAGLATETAARIAADAVQANATFAPFSGATGWHSVIADGVDNTGVTPTNLATTLSRGGVTYLPPGNYLIDPVGLPSGAQLIGAGKDLVTLTFHSPTTQTFMFATGSMGSSIALGANSPMGSITVTVASTTGIAVGGWCLIGDNAVPDSTYATRKAGELVRVSSFVANTSITFQSPQAFGYTTANSAFIQPMVPKTNIHVSGITFVNPVPKTTTASGLAFTRCVGVRLEDCDFRGIDNPNIGFDTCAEWSAQRVNCKDAESDDANGRYGYGLMAIGGSTAGEVLNSRFENVRHGFTTGGEDAGFGEATDILVSGVHVIGCKLAGLDTHGGSSDITFAACSVRGSSFSAAPGMQIRGNRHAVLGCRVYDTVASSVFMAQCQNARVIGNVLADASAIGIYIDGDITGSVIKGNTVSNYSTYGVFCSTNAAGSNVDIEDNLFKDYSTSAGYGIYLDGTLSFPRVWKNTFRNGWNGVGCTTTPSRPLIEDNYGANLNVGGAWILPATGSNAYVRRNRLENTQFTSSVIDSVTLVSNGNVNFDFGLGDYHRVTLQANASSIQWANTAFAEDRKITYVEFVQDATGARTVSFTGNRTYMWANGVAPTMSIVGGYRDIFIFAYDVVNARFYELSRSLGIH